MDHNDGAEQRHCSMACLNLRGDDVQDYCKLQHPTSKQKEGSKGQEEDEHSVRGGPYSEAGVLRLRLTLLLVLQGGAEGELTLQNTMRT